MHTLYTQIEQELARPARDVPFSADLEQRYQLDIQADRRRHLSICLLIGTLSFNSFLVWQLMLAEDNLWKVALQMMGTSVPFATLAYVLLHKVPLRWRETVAMLPSYTGLFVVYLIIVEGAKIRAMDQTLFIFCWPLMLVYTNTCMKSPFRVALAYNLFGLALTAVAVAQTSVNISTGGLMLTSAYCSAFFSLLGNYWTNREGRRTYLYRLREELRTASLSSANQDLRLLSQTDALTGLANRRQMQPHLDRLWARQVRGDATGAVLLVDIDHFKRFNDFYGHLMGDSCLQNVATTLQQALRPEDTIARFGGEEFVVLLNDVGEAEARQIGERLLVSIRSLNLVHLGREDGVDHLTVSIGMAHSSLAGVADSAALLDQADRALYSAKRHGRNCLEVARDSTTNPARTLPTPEDLRTAMAEGQFELYYQPIHQLPSQRLTGYECLLRWRSSEHGAVPPDIFIPMAESSGLIGALGDWVLEQACTAANGWPVALSLSVNISALQLADPELPGRLQRILVRTHFNPTRLVLELTESVLLEISPDVKANVQWLADEGVKLALDDFGSGHANLAYLLQLPFQLLKLDRRVLRIELPAQRREVLEALLKLGRAFSLEVVAEGVETAEDLTLLCEIGMDQGQGFLFGGPQPLPMAHSPEVTLKALAR